MMQSIRGHLIVTTALAMGLILALSGVVLYRSVRTGLLGEFDQALFAEARAISSMVEQERGRIKMEFEPGQLTEFRRQDHPAYFQLFSASGKILASSPSLAGKNLDTPSPRNEIPAHQYAQLPDGRPGRTIAMSFIPRLDDEEPGENARNADLVTLVVARDTESLNHSLGRIRALLYIVGGGATLLALCVMSLVIRKGLRPLNVLAQKIGSLESSRLAERIDLDDPPLELAPVVERLNDLLSRLDAAFAREKGLTADIAHELRTPLAGLEAAMEVCLSQPRNGDEYRRTLERCLNIARHSHVMANNLLMLARAEAGQLDVIREPVAIKPFVDECWMLFSARAEQRRLRVQWNTNGQCSARVDREKLRLVMHNLFDNAVTYCDDGGIVRVDIRCDSGKTQIDVVNTGSNLSRDDAAKVFDRFWRGDQARTIGGAHCGLGLTLCKRVVELLGGSIEVTSEQSGEFRVGIVVGE